MFHPVRLVAVLLATMLPRATLLAAEMPRADSATFKQQVAPLLESYCADCHGADDPEGKFSIETLDHDLLLGDGLEGWRLVDEQLRFKDMPPEDADQPSAAERATILNWIRQEMLKTQLPGVSTRNSATTWIIRRCFKSVAIMSRRPPRASGDCVPIFTTPTCRGWQRTSAAWRMV